MGAAVKTIRKHAFYKTKLTGLDLSGAASLESITDFAFSQTDITGTPVIPAKVGHIGFGVFYITKITGLELSNAASLVSIGTNAFRSTDITGTIVTPFNVPTYRTGGRGHHSPAASPSSRHRQIYRQRPRD